MKIKAILLIACFSFLINISKSDGKTIYPINTIEQLKVKNLKGDTISLLNEDIIQVFVFSKDYGCHDCYVKLNKAILKIKSELNSNFHIKVVIRTHNNLTSMITSKNYIKKLFDAEDYFFDIHSKQEIATNIDFEGGLFGYFKVNYSPSLLLVVNKKCIYIAYKELFVSDHVTVDDLYILLKEDLKK